MRKLVSSQTASVADRAAVERFGYPDELLMEEAGIRLQDRLERLEAEGEWPSGRVVYLAGPGHNGADAWVMARQAFLRGRDVVVVDLITASTLRQAEWARSVGVPWAGWPSTEAETVLRGASVWVDGAWGTGLRGPLRPDRAPVLASLEGLRKEISARVAAVDVPSGLWEGWRSPEPVLTATWILSPGPFKDFLYEPSLRNWSGTLIEVPLAFPQKAQATAMLVEDSDLPTLVPRVDREDHKGVRGHVALLGGSGGMSGALILAARSAAAAGAGLVSLAVDADLVPLVAPQVPAFQVRTAAELLDRRNRYQAWVVGPGWGRSEDRQGWLERVWSLDVPLVLDADGLAAWTELGRPSRTFPTVFTPHPGEFRRLGVGHEANIKAASALAQDKGVTVVLKGAVTWIVSPDRRAVWDGREPALGTGGSGDCLAGVVGAFLAAGQDPFEAAVAAVALHGVSGRDAARHEGWFTADVLPSYLARTAFACRTDRLGL